MKTLAIVLTAAAVLLFALPVGDAYVRLRTNGGLPFRWSSPGAVKFVINDQGSDDIPDASEEAAIRLGFAAWESVDGSALAFKENTKASQRARRDWPSDDLHTIMFDETGESGLFPGAGVIAVTPIEAFISNGSIADADIIFNGQLAGGFSTDSEPGSMDVWAVMTHEIGHFVGLNHSGIGAASLSPFIASGQLTPRSLGADDVTAARKMYSGAFAGEAITQGRISGRVRRLAGGASVSGAHVWARDAADGRVITGTISDGSGDYLLTGLPPGFYDVLAGPLDGPVSDDNLGSLGVPNIQTNFQPAAADPVVVVGTENVAATDILVPGNATLNATGPGTPYIFHPGESRTINISGPGTSTASVEVDEPQGLFDVVGNANVFQLSVDPAALPGAYDLRLENGSGVAIHNGFLEVVPLAPEVSGVTPDTVDFGTAFEPVVVRVDGANLDADMLVLFDGRPALDVQAVPGDADALDVQVPAGASGLKDLLVVNSAGEEALLEDGLDLSLVIRDRERVDGSIEQLGAETRTSIDALDGTTLTLTLKADKGSSLLPKLVVRAPGGAVLVSTDSGDPEFDPAFASVNKAGTRARLSKLVLGQMGRHVLELSGLTASTGGYRLTLKEKLAAEDRKLKVPKSAALPVDADTDAVLALSAKRGSTLTGKLNAADGLALELISLIGPSGELLGQPDVDAAITLDPEGRFVRFKKLPLADFGAYELTLGAATGTAGTVRGSLTIKPPKSKTTFEL